MLGYRGYLPRVRRDRRSRAVVFTIAHDLALEPVALAQSRSKTTGRRPMGSRHILAAHVVICPGGPPDLGCKLRGENA